MLPEERLPGPAISDQIDGLPVVGDGSGLTSGSQFFPEEVQLALRNRGMPLEAMRWPITPTGLHYLVIHWDIPDMRSADPDLMIDGLVANKLRLSLDALKARPAVTRAVTLECAGNGRALMSPRSTTQPWFVEGVSTVEWTGVRLRDVLEEAGLDDRAVDIVFTGADRGVQGGEVQRYRRSLTVDEAMREDVLLAYSMNGEPLPHQHGFPLRLIVPEWYGMASVKWLTRIDAVAEPFTGYQQSVAYHFQQSPDEPGEPATLMKPRALMIPPGITDFTTRARILDCGPVTLEGRAWAGRADIARVEVSVDNGVTWSAAQLDAPVSDYAWRGWSFDWNAATGRHTLCARATDTSGIQQPTEPPWNYQGMGNNEVQRVPVLVR